MIERWLTCPGWPSYEVSDLGRVRRRTPGKGARVGHILRPRRTRKGYVRVALHGSAGRLDRSIHTLVLEAFVGPRPPAHEANHRNGRKDDNALTNLEWSTPAENQRHARELGLSRPLRGERNGRAKLTEADVAAIRASTDTGDRLADRYGVSRSLISAIRRHEVWKQRHPNRKEEAA